MTEEITKKILVGEDERSLSKAMSQKLIHEGFSATAAYNGEEVLDALKKDNFDLIILDLIMPKMDGFTTIKEIRKINKDIPIMVISNLSQQEDEKRINELGAQEFLIKSDVSLIEIVKHVKSFLGIEV